jgi:hypothetical protein
MNSPRKVTDMSFHQHPETVPNHTFSRAFPQFTEVLYSDPERETQCKDLPYSGKYPSHGHQKEEISRIVHHALVGAGENGFLWYLSLSMIRLNIS